MTTFKEIRGTTIEVVSSDPSNPELGQIWYNSSSGTLKGSQYVAAWSAGGNLNTARGRLAGAGTQTATLAFGGQPSPTGATELYNGTSWTSNPTGLNTARFGLAGAGSQTSSLAFGGYTGTANTGATESFNGSTWTSVNSMNTARIYLSGCGTQTAALAAGGSAPSISGQTESWNGSSWTSVTSMNTARSYMAGCGTNTASLFFGGETAPGTQTESWNGSSWTTVNSLNTGRGNMGAAGTQTLAICMGGSPPGDGITATELWNGTSWTTNPNSLATARARGPLGAGTQAAAIIAGGFNPSATSATEEWNLGGATKTITVS